VRQELVRVRAGLGLRRDHASSAASGTFYIIGAIVVVLFVAGFFGLHA
jgi:hypothetical protein